MMRANLTSIMALARPMRMVPVEEFDLMGGELAEEIVLLSDAREKYVRELLVRMEASSVSEEALEFVGAPLDSFGPHTLAP